jgi:hypothetical protein
MSEDDRETTLRWKIDRDIELYKFYLDVSVKGAIFLMAVSGAIASYVLSKPGGTIISIALAFPAIVNAGFTVLFFHSITEAKRIEQVHIEASKELGVPEVNMKPLRSVCKIFCVMCGAATVGLLLLMAFHLRGDLASSHHPLQRSHGAERGLNGDASLGALVRQRPAGRPTQADRSAVLSSFTSPGNPHGLAGRDQGLVVIGGDAGIV